MRFLALVGGGWVAVRTALLWPTAIAVIPDASASRPPPEAVARASAIPIAPMRPTPPAALALPARPAQGPIVRTGSIEAIPHAITVPRRTAIMHPAMAPTLVPAPTDAIPSAFALATPVADAAPASPPVPGIAALPAPVSRWSASAWSIVRSGRGAPFAPQLGGSQAGARLDYALGAGSRFGIAARVSSALASRQNEAAVGLAVRAAAPVTLFAERRFGLGGIRGGYAAGAIAGINPTPIAGGFDLEAYGQAGAIVRDGIEGFGDGSVRLTRALATLGPARIALGGGAWGGAQRGVARLDIGPSLSAAILLAGRSMRIALDWRQRIAGNAAPASGPALSVGTDF